MTMKALGYKGNFLDLSRMLYKDIMSQVMVNEEPADKIQSYADDATIIINQHDEMKYVYKIYGKHARASEVAINLEKHKSTFKRVSYVRQGCSFSMILFMLSTISLINMIKADKRIIGHISPRTCTR